MRNTSKSVPRQALVGQNVSLPANSTVKLSTTDLNNLMQALDIDVIALTELLVPHGHRAEMGMIDAPGIHYNLSGVGRMSINGGPKMPLSPHLLIIVPPNTPIMIEVDSGSGPLKLISRDCWIRQDGILRIAAPNEQPEIVQICGFFNASFGQSVRLFGELREPVIEQFEPADKIDLKLREAMDELLQQEVGVGAMTASLLKQIVVSLVRRSLRSSQRWTERILDTCRQAGHACFCRYGGAAGSRPFSSKLGAQCRIKLFGVHGAILGHLSTIPDGHLARLENAPGCDRFDDNDETDRRRCS